MSDYLITTTKGCLVFLFVLAGIDYNATITLAGLMMFDLFFGSIKTIIMNEKYSFKRLGRGFVSKASMLMFPTIIGLMSKGTGFDFSKLSVGVLNVFVLSEGLSCLNNIMIIKTGKEIKNTDLTSRVTVAVSQQFARLGDRIISSLTIGVDQDQAE